MTNPTTPEVPEVSEEQRARAWMAEHAAPNPDDPLLALVMGYAAQESSRLVGYVRDAKHLISVRMEGFPCADGDDCENLKTLQDIAAALEGKEI